ncbi:hypothetical protein B0I22_3429 [Epilithonimonas xixisoli]|uniref:Uncharacterized protein n=1 Tax=Epilithonimonas xixisoli TaxID=1476462 RepID=A0A4R8ICA4_9FLAO|nr:hypothetical protein B0I22_3429 [Epilithonimonas xixisoli]
MNARNFRFDGIKNTADNIGLAIAGLNSQNPRFVFLFYFVF